MIQIDIQVEWEGFFWTCLKLAVMADSSLKYPIKSIFFLKSIVNQVLLIYLEL